MYSNGSKITLISFLFLLLPVTSWCHPSVPLSEYSNLFCPLLSLFMLLPVDSCHPSTPLSESSNFLCPCSYCSLLLLDVIPPTTTQSLKWPHAVCYLPVCACGVSPVVFHSGNKPTSCPFHFCDVFNYETELAILTKTVRNIIHMKA